MEIAVIGGGASGLAAAITAAKDGNNVTIYERQSRVGRKLLATGNGRCNLSNAGVSPERYHGADPDFASYALTRFDVNAVLDFFHSLGLLTVTEPDGRIYPFSDQAGSVVDVLRFAAEEAGASVKTGAEVYGIERKDGRFAVKYDDGENAADKVIICCGGMAGTKLGGTKSGYELLKSLGHSATKLYPSLVQIKTDNTFVKSLKGVRADASVKITSDGGTAESAGEVQFTEYGLSGPAVFEVSRAASVAKDGFTVSLDLMRDVSSDDVSDMIRKRKKTLQSITLENLLTGMLHNRLGRTVLRYAGFDLNMPAASLSDDDVEIITSAVKNFTLKGVGALGFDNAQVTAGGIKTSEFNPETLESRLVPGLYAAGEVLDIDGDCGGFNLQWAWASGMLAGRLL